jgi:thioredoxin-like negative regulator of GroEL
MSTSLERYAQAYQLQTDGKEEEAGEIYREIIRQFPASAEAGYAKIQLAEIFKETPEEEEEETEERHETGRKPTGILCIIGFILSLLACLVLIVFFIMHVRQGRKLEFQKTLSMALSASVMGNEKSFQLHLNRAMALSPRSKEPYLLLADAYLKKNNVKAAIKVIKACPVFDAEIKLYYERINKFGKKSKDSPE